MVLKRRSNVQRTWLEVSDTPSRDQISKNSLYKDFFTLHSYLNSLFRTRHILEIEISQWMIPCKTLESQIWEKSKNGKKKSPPFCVFTYFVSVIREIVWDKSRVSFDLNWEWEIIIEKNKHDKLAKLYKYYIVLRFFFSLCKTKN